VSLRLVLRTSPSAPKAPEASASWYHVFPAAVASRMGVVTLLVLWVRFAPLPHQMLSQKSRTTWCGPTTKLANGSPALPWMVMSVVHWKRGAAVTPWAIWNVAPAVSSCAVGLLRVITSLLRVKVMARITRAMPADRLWTAGASWPRETASANRSASCSSALEGAETPSCAVEGREAPRCCTACAVSCASRWNPLLVDGWYSCHVHVMRPGWSASPAAPPRRESENPSSPELSEALAMM
jgi:hypothetical protein